MKPRLAALAFLLPALAFYGIFVLYPLWTSLALSFTDWDGTSLHKTFVGVANYKRMLFADPVARIALKNNLWWGAFAVTIPPAAGLALALLLNRSFVGRTWMRAVFYGPNVLPLVAVALIWTWLYNPHFGLINEGLRALGLGVLARGWLSQVNTAFLSVLVTALWQGAGFPMLLYLAALQSIPTEQYEAAALDGCGPLRMFFFITLPWLKETTFVVATLSLVTSFKAFELIYAMTYGGPSRTTQTLATWTYFNTFEYHHPAYGSALSCVIAALCMLVTIPYVRLVSRGR